MLTTSTSELMTAWYRRDLGGSVHDDVVAYGKALQAAYRTSHQYDRMHERIYQATAMRRHGAALALLGRSMGGDALARLNASKAVVDTVVSRLSKKRAMPAFRVDNADWSLKQRAKKYRQFIAGKMADSDFEELSPLCLRDGGIVGSGIAQIDDDEDDVCAERVYRDELLVDPRECKYGKPWQLMRVMRVARDVLIDKYKGDAEMRALIRDCPSSHRPPHDMSDEPEMSSVMDLGAYVDVWKAWRRSSGPGAGDGRVALCIENATLSYEKWECERFPFAIYRYDHPTRGFWGRGLIEQVADLQHRINCIVRDVQKNIEVVAMGSYMVNEAYDLPVETMTGSAPFKLLYRGPQAPNWNAPSPVNPQVMQLLEFFIRQIFELPGVSQAAASSKSSLGLGASGVALDTQYDIESERFAMAERQYAKFRLDAGQCFLDAAKRVAKRAYDDKGKKRSKSGYTANWRERYAMRTIEYKDAAIDEGRYRLELEPVSFIPDTRAGKFATVQELTAAGIIPQWLAAALYDEPDLQRAQLINCSAFFNLERIMEEIGDGKYVAPEPYHDLALAEKMGLAYYNWAQSENADEEIQDGYRQFVDSVRELKGGIAEPNAAGAMPADPMAAMAAGPMPPAAPPPMPPGPGMPPDMGGMGGAPPIPMAA